MLFSVFVLLALVTAGLFLLPGFGFAIIAPEAENLITTAATIAAGSVAGFAWIRYRDSGRYDALLQSSAFLTLFAAGLMRGVLRVSGHELYAGFEVGTPGQAPLYAWTFGGLLTGALLLAGAISTLNRWSPRRTPALLIVLLGPLLTLGYTIVVLGLEPSLPILLAPEALHQLIADGNILSVGVISPALLVTELVIAFIFGVAAMSYGRVWRRGERDGYTAVLAVSLLFAAFSQVQFALVPGAYGDLLTSGDFFRLAFYLLVLAAVGAAIADDLRKLRGANVDLERLRYADAERAGAEERARLAREVHDGLVQELWLARLTGGRLGELPRLPPDAREMLQRLDVTLESAQAEARQALLTLQLRSDIGFGELLRRFVDDYADRFDMDITAHVDHEVAPPPEVQSELLRICREALNNARKHADATVVSVTLEQDVGVVRLVIVDNGRGFEPATLDGRGFGLQSMRQRADKIDGRLDISSEPMGGTKVTLELSAPIAN